MFFSVAITLFLIDGIQKNSLQKFIATIVTILMVFGLCYFTMAILQDKGLRFEDMSVLTRPYRPIYLASLLIGAIGASLDTVVTVISTLEEIELRNNKVTLKQLIQSGKTVGNDNSGTMINVLICSYFSSAIPVMQLPLVKKIAIVGPNSAGKSTLLQAILEGHSSIVLSPKIKIETYRQMDYQLSSQRSLLLELMTETDWLESIVRSLLHHLGFSQDEVLKPLSVLSGGEATRIAIAQLFTRPSNLLILDEPTNFIDLATIQALEMFLKEYTETVLFTSHDPHFIELADEVWELKDGKLVQ